MNQNFLSSLDLTLTDPIKSCSWRSCTLRPAPCCAPITVCSPYDAMQHQATHINTTLDDMWYKRHIYYIYSGSSNVVLIYMLLWFCCSTIRRAQCERSSHYQAETRSGVCSSISSPPTLKASHRPGHGLRRWDWQRPGHSIGQLDPSPWARTVTTREQNRL